MSWLKKVFGFFGTTFDSPKSKKREFSDGDEEEDN